MNASILLPLLVLLPLSGLAEEEGFKPLFNGKDLSGWVPCNVAADTFSVKDDMIVTTGEPIGVMRTEKMYENFIIELDWRHMKDAGNSGIFIWGEGLPAPGVPYARGIEVQILDLGYAKNKGANEWFTTHGDIFPIWGATMTPTGKLAKSGVRSFPVKELTLPSPQWNHYRVECNDGAIKLSVNGELVTTGEDCNPRKGFICLESEGSECHFKNIRIKELPSTNATEAQTARSYEGFKPLFNGKDIAGWKSDDTTAWSSDGVVFKATAGGAPKVRNLSSEKEFGDFVLCVDLHLTDKTAPKDFTIELRGLGVPLGGSLPVDIGVQALADFDLSQWHRFFITVKGGKVSVESNDKEVSSATYSGNFSKRGPIIFKNHGAAYEFRNIFIKEL